MLFIYITRLASKEIFSPSNKIHREVGRTRDLSAPLYCISSSLDPRSYFRLHVISSYLISYAISSGYVMLLTWKTCSLPEWNELVFAVKYNDFVQYTRYSEIHHYVSRLTD